MPTGVIVLVVAVAFVVVFGAYRLFTDGRFAGTHRVRGVTSTDAEPMSSGPLTDTPWEAEMGERATLLQFSSAFCAPCRATRRILEDVAATVPGVAHIEVDAEQHLDVVRRLGILRTPTTIIIDGAGQELTRASGAPTKQQVLVALADAID